MYIYNAHRNIQIHAYVDAYGIYSFNEKLIQNDARNGWLYRFLFILYTRT